MQSTTFQYKRSIQIAYQGCMFHSLMELKYILSIEDTYWFLREHIPIWYDPKTCLPTRYIRESTKKYKPDFLIRNKVDGSALLIELKPKGFNDVMQINTRTRVAENYIRSQSLDWKFKVVYGDEIVLTPEKQGIFTDLRNNICSFIFKRHMEYIDKKFSVNQRNYFRTIPSRIEKNMTPSGYAKLVKYGSSFPNKIL